MDSGVISGYARSTGASLGAADDVFRAASSAVVVETRTSRRPTEGSSMAGDGARVAPRGLVHGSAGGAGGVDGCDGTGGADGGDSGSASLGAIGSGGCSSKWVTPGRWASPMTATTTASSAGGASAARGGWRQARRMLAASTTSRS